MHHSFTILIDKDTLCFIQDSRIQFQAQVTPLISIFLLGETIPVQHLASPLSSLPLPLDLALCNYHLCYHHVAGVKKLLSGNLMTEFKLDSQADPDLVYKPCKAGKMHANPFLSSSSRAS
jgi:hypothetical protein